MKTVFPYCLPDFILSSSKPWNNKGSTVSLLTEFGKNMANLNSGKTASMKHLKMEFKEVNCTKPREVETMAILLMVQQINDLIDHAPITAKQKSF